MEDIFVPTSSPADATVGPLDTVTYITNQPDTVETIFRDGYDLSSSGWQALSPSAADYFGVGECSGAQICTFSKQGAAGNIEIRVLKIEDETPQVRPDYSGLYHGGATISFPIDDLRGHESRMAGIGVASTIGVKEMEFTSPTGETYISAEIVYKAPENVFVMGVTRPDIFIPTGPIDPATGMGGASYSARCMAAGDATVAFFRDVLGYEIRRDVEFTVGDRSALLMPEGTTERFVQGFAPGSNTGYIVLMDHMDATKASPAPSLGTPNRGIGMWTFPTRDIEAVARKAAETGIEVIQPVAERTLTGSASRRRMIVRDPDGFPIEFIEQ